MKRIHNSDSDSIITARVYRKLDRCISSLKPFGLWYSINYEWLEWCGENDFGIEKNFFDLDIDLTDVLQITTIEELSLFFYKYRNESKYLVGIDWLSVKLNYKGIEIRNYQNLRHNNNLGWENDTWFYGWDVSSGCIWDLSAVKSYKKIEVPLLNEQS